MSTDPKRNPFGEAAAHLPERGERQPAPPKRWKQPTREELAERHNNVGQGSGGVTWHDLRARGPGIDVQAGPGGTRTDPNGAGTGWNGKLSGL
jgi:hypothetical protein